ncbi:MAG TPA: hypothetical protein VG387_11275 [Rhizomicrobium sp.]|jgi:hypothetical protein|nr:hypothetical protein [Rhizomicrobium sp.]
MLGNLYHALRKTTLWQAVLGPIYHHRQVETWFAAHRPVPAPGHIKARNLLALADIYNIDVLLETGTFQGDTIAATASRFKKIISIEIFAPLAEAAKRRFAGRSHIQIVQGDSGTAIPAAIADIREPILFWLDGHYSGQGTGTGALHSPVIAEIDNIAKLRAGMGDVIVIDDARCFDGTQGYPALEPYLADLKARFGVTPRVADDSIFLLPA